MHKQHIWCWWHHITLMSCEVMLWRHIMLMTSCDITMLFPCVKMFLKAHPTYDFIDCSTWVTFLQWEKAICLQTSSISETHFHIWTSYSMVSLYKWLCICWKYFVTDWCVWINVTAEKQRTGNCGTDIRRTHAQGQARGLSVRNANWV